MTVNGISMSFVGKSLFDIGVDASSGLPQKDGAGLEVTLTEDEECMLAENFGDERWQVDNRRYWRCGRSHRTHLEDQVSIQRPRPYDRASLAVETAPMSSEKIALTEAAFYIIYNDLGKTSSNKK